uniref:Ig-like domain-containing protein n=1 Tax=Oncorhynchus tshawytscha TaxID=74940 RepID=A0AAZ3Q075_ONCTS
PDSEQELTPYTDVEVASERDRVTLFCNYTSSGVTLLWYRQYPKSAPQLLVMEYADITPGFTLNHDKNAKRTDLKISSAEVTDSAMYYCALRPTVTGNPETLYKNLTSHERVFLLRRFYLTIMPSSGVNTHPFYCVKRRSLVLHMTCNVHPERECSKTR